MAKKENPPKEQATIIAFKGTDKDLQCKGFQYEIGKEFTHKGVLSACNSGFHACEYPLDVFGYYCPADNRFFIVEQAGDLSRHSEDSKVASRKITIKAEIGIVGLVKAAIEYTTSRCKPVDPVSPAFNSGDCGASTNSGTRGASTNSGDRGASTNSGYGGASTNSGTRGASTNSGYGGVAADFSGTGKARSSEDGAIVCLVRNDDGSIKHIRSSKVGENGVKPNTWYTLNADGDFMEVS